MTDEVIQGVELNVTPTELLSEISLLTDISPEIISLYSELEVLRILAGGTEKVNDNGNTFFRSAGYRRNDNNSILSGADVRVAAAVLLNRANPQLQIITGSKYPDDSLPAPALVMKEELMLSGVNPKNIQSDLNTLDTIAEIASLISQAGREELRNVGIVTSNYHIERVNAIIANIDWLTIKEEREQMGFGAGLKKLRNGSLNLIVISAEEIVEKIVPEVYQKYKEPEGSKRMGVRLEMEQKGISDIQNGKYQRINPNNPQEKIIVTRLT